MAPNGKYIQWVGGSNPLPKADIETCMAHATCNVCPEAHVETINLVGGDSYDVVTGCDLGIVGMDKPTRESKQ